MQLLKVRRLLPSRGETTTVLAVKVLKRVGFWVYVEAKAREFPAGVNVRDE